MVVLVSALAFRVSPQNTNACFGEILNRERPATYFHHDSRQITIGACASCTAPLSFFPGKQRPPQRSAECRVRDASFSLPPGIVTVAMSVSI